MRTRCIARTGLPTALLVIAMVLMPEASHAQWRTRWSYSGTKGPAHWAELDADYASCNGKAQSPVDIEATRKANLPPLKFESRNAPLHGLVNNGYTIRVNYHDAPGTGDFLTVGSERYQLIQFHFHQPSEERVHGRAYDMVAHLMYRAADGKVAGVAVLLKAGKANATVQKVWDHMPKTESKILKDFSHQEKSIPGVEIDPARLLPEDLAYYTYAGSVTAPPCTENVTWFILKTPVEVSSDQINAFKALYANGVRADQPLNGRVVMESK